MIRFSAFISKVTKQQVERYAGAHGVKKGAALTFSVLGRSDLLRSKLFALADRGIDIEDCLALEPTAEELAECLPWLEQQDGNEMWPKHVQDTLAALGRRLGHGV